MKSEHQRIPLTDAREIRKTIRERKRERERKRQRQVWLRQTKKTISKHIHQKTSLSFFLSFFLSFIHSFFLSSFTIFSSIHPVSLPRLYLYFLFPSFFLFFLSFINLFFFKLFLSTKISFLILFQNYAYTRIFFVSVSFSHFLRKTWFFIRFIWVCAKLCNVIQTFLQTSTIKLGRRGPRTPKESIL